MFILPVSLTIAAGAALLNLWLMMRVGRVRTQEKISVGDGGNERLQRRMRAHSNYIENTAFVLILLALIELAIGSSLWLWAVGVLYLVARILHAFGMDGMGWARMAGTLGSMLVQLGLAIIALVSVYTATGKPVITEIGETEVVLPQ
ncbi:MAPEG family protein [Sphingopyxis sp. MWB1]|uniref:MAPEG family protein n=1 Tax=Sphingopyxis sp. MWB1 TaxID=1537715 RepID=UPI00051A7B4E|nr:MAPEG family protein [Sphingopyxis sp. MWB1]